MKSFRCFLSFLQMIKQHCSSVYFKLQRVKLPIALRLLSALFPRHCPVCAKLVPYGTLIHAECQTVLPFISGPTCLRCGKPVSSSAQEYCYDCRTFPKSFQKGLSLFLYNKEIKVIYGLKKNDILKIQEYTNIDIEIKNEIIPLKVRFKNFIIDLKRAIKDHQKEIIFVLIGLIISTISFFIFLKKLIPSNFNFILFILNIY